MISFPCKQIKCVPTHSSIIYVLIPSNSTNIANCKGQKKENSNTKFINRYVFLFLKPQIPRSHHITIPYYKLPQVSDRLVSIWGLHTLHVRDLAADHDKSPGGTEKSKAEKWVESKLQVAQAFQCKMNRRIQNNRKEGNEGQAANTSHRRP